MDCWISWIFRMRWLTGLPAVASRESPSRHSEPRAQRKRAFSSRAADPGRNMLNTAISSLFSCARRIRSAPTVFVAKLRLAFWLLDDSVDGVAGGSVAVVMGGERGLLRDDFIVVSGGWVNLEKQLSGKQRNAIDVGE